MTDLASPDNNRLSVDFVPRSEVRGTSSSVVEEGSSVVDSEEIKRRKEANREIWQVFASKLFTIVYRIYRTSGGCLHVFAVLLMS